MRDYLHFSMKNCAIFVISGHARSTEYKIQLQAILKVSQLYIHLVHCGTKKFWLPVLWKILNHSFWVVENLHCDFFNVETSNCTFHMEESIKRYFPFCGNYQRFFHKIIWLCTLWNKNYFTSIFVDNFKPDESHLDTLILQF